LTTNFGDVEFMPKSTIDDISGFCPEV